jgi:hypothetical protein
MLALEALSAKPTMIHMTISLYDESVANTLAADECF